MALPSKQATQRKPCSTTIWRVRRPHGSLIHVDGNLLVLDGSGRLYLADATPDAWHMKGRVPLLHGSTWNQPALANGIFYARSREHLVAVRVGAPGKQPEDAAGSR